MTWSFDYMHALHEHEPGEMFAFVGGCNLQVNKTVTSACNLWDGDQLIASVIFFSDDDLVGVVSSVRSELGVRNDSAFLHLVPGASHLKVAQGGQIVANDWR